VERASGRLCRLSWRHFPRPPKNARTKAGIATLKACSTVGVIDQLIQPDFNASMRSEPKRIETFPAIFVLNFEA